MGFRFLFIVGPGDLDFEASDFFDISTPLIFQILKLQEIAQKCICIQL